MGKDEYPWGTEWPPPPGSGNFLDEASKRGQFSHWYTLILSGYNDGYDATAPVGSFTPNSLGIHDLAGNVSELVGNGPGAGRGSSYLSFNRNELASAHGFRLTARSSTVGFRVVCVVWFWRAEAIGR